MDELSAIAWQEAQGAVKDEAVVRRRWGFLVSVGSYVTTSRSEITSHPFGPSVGHSGQRRGWGPERSGWRKPQMHRAVPIIHGLSGTVNCVFWRSGLCVLEWLQRCPCPRNVALHHSPAEEEMTMSTEQQEGPAPATGYSQWFILITAVFITCLVTANITAVTLSAGTPASCGCVAGCESMDCQSWSFKKQARPSR